MWEGAVWLLDLHSREERGDSAQLDLKRRGSIGASTQISIVA
jgi:hypothetical protein